MAIDKLLERPAADDTRDDAGVGAYLDLLKRDIDRGHGAFGRFCHDVVDRWRKLVADVKIDRENDRIEGDVGL